MNYLSQICILSTQLDFLISMVPISYDTDDFWKFRHFTFWGFEKFGNYVLSL